jgi:hypothetical protein
VGQRDDKRVPETTALRKWYFPSSVEHVWMAVLKQKFFYQFSHGNKRLFFCGNIIWPFTSTDTVVSADIEHDYQHL